LRDGEDDLTGVTGQPDEIVVAVAEAAALGHGGDRAAARRALEELWGRVGPDGDALRRCAVAHALADVCDDPVDEVAWDERALAAADDITDERARDAGATGPVAAFYPSLHLNLGEGYRKLGDDARARQHLARGLAAVDALPDDGYGRLIRGGLTGLAERLA
jgi:hypothetical protein